MLMVSTVSMTSTIITQPASNFSLLTDHTIPGLLALLPTSATHTVHSPLTKVPPGHCDISMLNHPRSNDNTNLICFGIP